jgi:AraC family ethanolamine operon transcriptional activator
MSGLLLEKVRIDGVEDVHRLLDGPSSTCVPLGPSVPHGALLLAPLGDIFLRAGELSMDARGTAAFDDENRILLEMKLDSESRLFSLRSGKDVLAGDVYVVCPGDVTDYRLNGRLSFALLSMTPDFLLRQGGEDTLRRDKEFWIQRRWFRAPPATRALIARSVQRILYNLVNAKSPITGAALGQLQAELCEAFLWGIMLHENKSSERHALSGAAIVRRVDEWVDGRASETIQIGDLCRELHLSRRTLQRAFTETLGIGPARYLSNRRLTAVRAELRRADPTSIRVTDTATKYGFWQLGRFARDYRQMFGECPSETLNPLGREKRRNGTRSGRSAVLAQTA